MNKKRLIFFTLFMLGISGVLFFYFSYNPSSHSFFLACPFKYVTGYHCPGCGSQRAIHQLLHGDFMAAMSLNPLLLLSLPVILYGLGLKVYNYLFEKQRRFQLFYNKRFIYIYFGLVIVYWVVRNIPIYPFTVLSPDY